MVIGGMVTEGGRVSAKQETDLKITKGGDSNERFFNIVSSAVS
jgi:hypothetical protein